MKNLITSMILALLMLLGYDPQAAAESSSSATDKTDQVECRTAQEASSDSAALPMMGSRNHETEDANIG